MKVVFAQDMLTFLDGALSFQRPAGVTMWEERPRPSHEDFWTGRIQLAVSIYDRQTFLTSRTSRDLIIAEEAVYNTECLRDALLGLFAATPEFVIHSFDPRLTVRKSYRSLQTNGVTIGESFFSTSATNLQASGWFVYSITIVAEDRLVFIHLSLWAGDENNPLREIDGFFVTRNGSLFWADDKAPLSFYEQLSSDRYKEMPVILRQLREAYDTVMQTLQIRQDGKMTGIDIVSPLFEFQKTHTTSRAVNLRGRFDAPDAPPILTVPENTDVQLLSVIKSAPARSEILFPLVVIATEDGFTGMVSSRYLYEIVAINDEVGKIDEIAADSAVYEQGMLAFLDGAFSFQKPADVTLREEMPHADDPNHEDFRTDRIQLAVDIYDRRAFLNSRAFFRYKDTWEAVYNNECFQDALLGLLAATPEFALFHLNPRRDVRRSYKSLQINGAAVGESFFSAAAANLRATGDFAYNIMIVAEDRLAVIRLSLFTGEENNPLRELDGFSVMRNGTLFWTDDKAQILFYEQLSSERYKEMPVILRRLREAYDTILQTLKIRQGGSGEMAGVDIISPSFEFQRTHTVNRWFVSLRGIDDVYDTPPIRPLPENTEVQVLSVIRPAWSRDWPVLHFVAVTEDGFAGVVSAMSLAEIAPVNDEAEKINETKENKNDDGYTNEITIPANAEEIVVNNSERAWLWLLLLLIPLSAVVAKKIKTGGTDDGK